MNILRHSLKKSLFEVLLIRLTIPLVYIFYVEVYINWLYLIFLYLFPFTLLAVFNILIYSEVRRANTIRASLSRYKTPSGHPSLGIKHHPGIPLEV
jgi:hypothetical protein